MKSIDKDILTVDEGIILHQVNCIGKMGAGLSLAIASKYPKVRKEFAIMHGFVAKDSYMQLGNIIVTTVVPQKLAVVGVYGQYDVNRPGERKKKTVYPALSVAFMKVNMLRRNMQLTVYIPHEFGCGLGGGNWQKVLQLIEKYIPDAVICWRGKPY